MRKTMLVKPELLVKDMTLISPDSEHYRVERVEHGHEATAEVVVFAKAKKKNGAFSDAIIRFALHAHDYARISARIPAHVRGEVLARAGVTGEWMYAEEHADKPRRYRFTWIPRTAMRFGGYGDQALTYNQLKRMSDFALTSEVPQE